MGRKKAKIISKEVADGIIAVAKVAAFVGTIAYTLKSGSSAPVSKAKDIADTAVKVGVAAKAAEAGKEAIANVQNAARYEVQFKAFRTGEWYTKTLTDFKNSAYGVAKAHSQGRASRVIDHLTGEIVDIFEGAPEIYAKYL